MFTNISTMRSVASVWCLVVIIGITLNSHGAHAQGSCINPNSKPGTCISIYECPAIIELLRKPDRSDQETSFLLATQCNNVNPPFVCCTADKDYVPNENLPVPNQCGHQSLGDKIYNGNNTLLDEYPWMALLEYRNKKGENELSCGGSLINQRYILTAAHCVKGKIEAEIGPLLRIRLGEYDKSQEIDCVRNDCNQKVVEVGYEQVIPHPQYDPKNTNNYNDIALIRLEKNIQYNDFIRPICLPLASNRKPISPGELLVVAGWGRTLDARTSSIKQKLAIPIVDQNECAQKFGSRRVTISNSQLCAGGEFSRDSCDGDSGGPLMRESYKKRWYLEGIVSFGNKCGLEGWPGVYTKVAEYMDWIQQNVKP